MPVKPLNAPFPNVKALVVVILLAVLASAVAVPDGVVRQLQAIELLNATSTNRPLRSSVDSVISNHANTDGERRLVVDIEGMATKLKDKVSSLTSKLQIRWWLRQHETPDSVFAILKLKDADTRLFQTREFLTWYSFVKKLNPKIWVVSEMYKTLLRQFKTEAAVATVLHSQSFPKMEKIAEELRNYQFLEWQDQLNPMERSFEILELNKLKANEGFATPLSEVWFTFVTGESYLHLPTEYILEFLSKEYGVRNLIEAVAVKQDKSPIAKKLLQLQLQQWHASRKTPESVFEILELNELKANEGFATPLFDVWFTFNTGESYLHLPTEKILEFLTNKYGVRKLIEAVAVKRTDATKKLLKLQLDTWMKADLTEEMVYKNLKLSQHKTSDLENKVRFVWIDYVRMRSEKLAPSQGASYHEKQVAKYLVALDGYI